MITDGQIRYDERFRVLEAAAGGWVARSIALAIELRLADIIGDHPVTPAELAQLTDFRADSIFRLLRALVRIGIFEEVGQGAFRGTPRSKLLSKNSNESISALASLYSTPTYTRAWQDAKHTFHTGQPAFEHVYGTDRWDFHRSHPSEDVLFAEAMGQWSRAFHSKVVENFEWSSFHMIVDVGGGNGQLLLEIAKRYPALRAVLLDRPELQPVAAAKLQACGIADRVEFVGANFFDPIPVRGDLFLLAHVLIDWDDERASRILKNCRAAMEGEGRLVIIDQLIPSKGRGYFTEFLDLHIMIMSGGRVRTAEEFANLLHGAGFRVVNVRDKGEGSVLIEAVAAG